MKILKSQTLITPTLEDEEESAIPDSSLTQIYDLLTAFFTINPTPTDLEFHSLASAIRVSPEDLEAIVYKIMGVMFTKSEDSPGDAGFEDSEDFLLVSTDEDDEENPESLDPDMSGAEDDLDLDREVTAEITYGVTTPTDEELLSEYLPAEGEDDGAPDLDTVPEDQKSSKVVPSAATAGDL